MNTTENKITGLSKSFSAAVILTIAGIGAWIYQLVSGMHVTGLHNGVVWGLYIAAIFAALGGGAALLAIAGFSEFKNTISPAAKCKTLVVVITAFLVGAVLITMDLGNPIQVFRLIISFNFHSMMLWDFWVLGLCLLVALLYLFKVRKSGNGGKGFGIAAIAAALLIIAVEGLMLSRMPAHNMWGSGMTVVSFLVNAAIVGCALAMLIMPKNESIRNMLLTVLVLSLVVTLAEVFHGIMTDNPEAKAEMMFVLSGTVAPFFWGQLIIGLLVPILLLIKGASRLASVILAVVGVILEKTWLLAAGQAGHWMQESFSVYSPSVIEYITLVGAVGIGVLLYKLLIKLFNFEVSPAVEDSNMLVL